MVISSTKISLEDMEIEIVRTWHLNVIIMPVVTRAQGMIPTLRKYQKTNHYGNYSPPQWSF